jgi:hypothetical protein
VSTPLARAHILGGKRLRDGASQALKRIWQNLPSHDRPNLDQWLSEVLPIVESAQRQSVALTNAYLARALERQPVGLDVTALIGATVRNGTPPEEVYTRPFVTLWSELGEGKPWEEAAAMGLSRAVGAAATDVQLSMRGTLGAVQQADPSIYGYERVTDGAACNFCLEVDGAYVFSGDAFPLHSGCGCGVSPLEAPHRGAVRLPDGTQVRDFQYGPLNPQPLPEGVAVKEHGEMGAVLVDPSQHFMTEAEALAR